jgi:predicted nucleotide-binding protein
MRHYVASFHPLDDKYLNDKGKNIENLWKVGKFVEAEKICQEIYEYIISIEKKLLSGQRYHKGGTLYNWGISLINQEDNEKELLGVSRIVLAYVEDLFDHDSFAFAKELPASKIIRTYYQELEPDLREIELLVDGAISAGKILKDPLDLFDLDFNSFTEWIKEKYVSRRPKATTFDVKNKNKVFLVHGRNLKAKKAMIDFLESIKIEVLDWDQIIRATRNPNPYLLEIIQKGFELAQAVVVIMTPDDSGKLRKELCSNNENIDEKKLRYRPRQNVAYEAGMALGLNPRRTVLVELGTMKLPSDLSGMHTVRMNDTIEKREELASKLRITQCILDMTGEEWKNAGEFDQAILFE